jgi:hypothetical protein
MITGAQARASEVAAALNQVATAVANASAVVAELNVALMRDRQPSETSETSRPRGNAPGPVAAYVDFEPGLGFADWRCEVLSLLEAG